MQAYSKMYLLNCKAFSENTIKDDYIIPNGESSQLQRTCIDIIFCEYYITILVLMS